MATQATTVGIETNRKGWKLPLFFVVWTAFAALAVWWLLQPAAAGARPQVLFDSNLMNELTLGERIRQWLKLADLNFRGAYPWLLFAPYVLWLAARFHLERGRLRLNVPVHLVGCAVFAVAAWALAEQPGEKTRSMIVVSGQSNGMPFPKEFLTNWPGMGPPFGNMGNVERRINFQTSTSYVAGVDVRVANVRSSSGSASFATSTTTTSPRSVARLFPHFLNILAYAALAGIAHAVHFQRRLRERERRAVLLESHLSKARLHALQAQLHPHFLFNALNAVATLLRRDPKLAEQALTSFSELLRLALSQSDKQEISLRDDLLFLERYVEIQKIRLGDRFHFEQVIEPGLLDCQVPALLLQPLVENCLRHGIEPSPNPGTVRVEARQQNGRLRLRVEDNGIGLSSQAKSADGTGIGLANLRARLETIYGAENKLELAARPEGGVRVEVEIPLRRSGETTATA